MSRYKVGFITAPSLEEAEKIARALVEGKLAACVNCLPGVRSIYRWQGRVESAREALLIVKTSRDNTEKVIRRVRALHEYSVPEIIFFDIERGHKAYLQWIGESLRTRP